jgi:hypothetical protein
VLALAAELLAIRDGMRALESKLADGAAKPSDHAPLQPGGARPHRMETRGAVLSQSRSAVDAANDYLLITVSMEQAASSDMEWLRHGVSIADARGISVMLLLRVPTPKAVARGCDIVRIAKTCERVQVRVCLGTHPVNYDVVINEARVVVAYWDGVEGQPTSGFVLYGRYVAPLHKSTFEIWWRDAIVLKRQGPLTDEEAHQAELTVTNACEWGALHGQQSQRYLAQVPASFARSPLVVKSGRGLENLSESRPSQDIDPSLGGASRVEGVPSGSSAR